MNNSSVNSYIKSIFLTILFVLASLSSLSAQSNLINIDEQSLKKSNSDPITGLNIDKIETDHSNRPCARLKIHINRMPIHELQNIEVRPIGGNIMVNKFDVLKMSNGISVELTANPAVKLFLHHPKYGDSNTVTLSLNPDEQYTIESSLNEYISIFITTDYQDAEVYLDDMAYGKTNEAKSMTIPDIMVGKHHVKLVYQDKTVEKDIYVTRKDISFHIQFPDIKRNKNYIVFNVSPQEALLEFDGEAVTLVSGTAEKFLNEGVYKYKVTANEYHAEEGEIRFDGLSKKVVEVNLRPAFGSLLLNSSSLTGAKVYIDNEYKGVAPMELDKLSSGTHTLRLMKAMYKPHEETIQIKDQEQNAPFIELIPNFCNVSIYVGNNADIYINSEFKGREKWTGILEYGLYNVECRLENHKTSVTSLEITPDKENKYTLDKPEPIYSTLNITSSPSGAQIEIDGVNKGESPLYFSQYLIGKHRIKATIGTTSVEEYIHISENEDKNVHLVLGDVGDVQKPVKKKTPKIRHKSAKPSALSWIISGGYNMDMGLPIKSNWKGSELEHGYNASVAFHYHPARKAFYCGAGVDVLTSLDGSYLPSVNLSPVLGFKIGHSDIRFDTHLNLSVGYNLAVETMRYGGGLGIGIWFKRYNLDFNLVTANTEHYYKKVDDSYVATVQILPISLQIKFSIALGKQY